MFKINKLENVENEKVTINLVTQENYIIDTKEHEEFKTLTFDIEGKLGEIEYSLTFDLNCRLEELLKLEHSETIDISNYIFESYFTVNGIPDTFPKIDITINRWINNKFIVLIHFYTEILTENEDIYSGIIEFDFNLDDYLLIDK